MNIQPPLNMLSTLAAQSFFYYRPALLLHLCDYIAQNKITVDKFFLRKLETSLDKIKRKIVDFVSLPATTQTNSNPYKNIFFIFKGKELFKDRT
jgi:hypothetical protein